MCQHKRTSMGIYGPKVRCENNIDPHQIFLGWRVEGNVAGAIVIICFPPVSQRLQVTKLASAVV